jgi:methionine-rich copper-binding protein CopC
MRALAPAPAPRDAAPSVSKSARRGGGVAVVRRSSVVPIAAVRLRHRLTLPTARRADTKACRLRPRRAAVILTVVAAACLALASSAGAHSLLLRSAPAADSTLAGSPSMIVLTFTEAPDPNLSLVEIVDSRAHPVAGVSKPRSIPGRPNELQVTLGHPLPKGVYTVNWRSVSTVDGHVSADSFAFGIGVVPPENESGCRRVRRDVGMADRCSSSGQVAAVRRSCAPDWGCHDRVGGSARQAAAGRRSTSPAAGVGVGTPRRRSHDGGRARDVGLALAAALLSV